MAACHGQSVAFTSYVLDDMIICGKTDEEHLANLNKVLEYLGRFGLLANIDKCEFFKEQVSYSGHIISEEGLKINPIKSRLSVLHQDKKTFRNSDHF